MIKCEHFSIESDSELVCPCCKKERLDDEFMTMLGCGRMVAGIPLIINSGYRCADYQAELASLGFETAQGTSPHENGVAVDIHCTDPQKRSIIISALMKVGFNRFGIAKTFLHADLDKSRLANRIWVYNKR